MTRADLDRVRLEWRLLDGPLRRVEDAERAILTGLGCPTDPVALHAILTGATPAPWPASTAEPARQRALHAMHVLVAVAEVRRHAAVGHENARLAAAAALRAGLFAGDAVRHVIILAEAERARTRATKAAARQRRDEARDLDEAILTAARAYWARQRQVHDCPGPCPCPTRPGPCSVPAVALHVAPAVNRAARTVRRHLEKKLGHVRR